jgi:hypothetical protein
MLGKAALTIIELNLQGLAEQIGFVAQIGYTGC